MATAVTAVFLSTAATSALAQQPPIQIQQCTVLEATPTVGHPFWYPFGPWYHPGVPVADGIRIVFVNHAPVAANRVAFFVNYRGDKERIVDAGTFSPNVTIDHTFGNFSGDVYIGPKPNTCAVRAVRFSDGTTWRTVTL